MTNTASVRQPNAAPSPRSPKLTVSQILWRVGIWLQFLVSAVGAAFGGYIAYEDAQETTEMLHGLGLWVGGIIAAVAAVAFVCNHTALSLAKSYPWAAAFLGAIFPTIVSIVIVWLGLGSHIEFLDDLIVVAGGVALLASWFTITTLSVEDR